MHVFEYVCSSCLKNFDVLELPGVCTATPGCPHCGGRDLVLGGKKGPENEPGDEGDEDADEDDLGEEDEDLEEDEEEFPGASELN